MFKTLALAILKPAIAKWISTRALVLPQVKVDAAAKRLGVDPSVIQAVNQMLIQQAVADIDNLLK